jgi:uncharacterized membrane protein
MRAVGLAFLLFGSLAFTFPWYSRWVDDWISLSSRDSLWIGGLLVACGAATLLVHRSRQE